MAENTVMLRVYKDTKKQVDRIAAKDRRSIQETIDILLLEAIAARGRTNHD